uniref:MADF domain-containing protein n=1 Tax=Heliothis virescens TaxID=7102 RepID=A0A2A4IZX1_HELVI
MNMSWSNEEIFKFIDLYKKEPSIWNKKHELYKDRTKAQEAWRRLEYAMQMPVGELKKKKETLMTAFRLHHKRVLHSIHTHEDEVYKPGWTFYEPLKSFLKDLYDPPSADGFTSTSYRQELEVNDELDEDNLNDSGSEKQRDIKPNLRLVKSFSGVPLELQEVSKEMTNAFNTLNQALKNSKRHAPKEEDDCDLYGRLMAKRLRQFSETERQEIMYELDGLLLSRCTGNNEIVNNSDLSDS